MVFWECQKLKKLNKMSKILVLQGCPATGKSTYAKKFVKENDGWIRVNRDDIRRMFGEYWVPKREQIVEYTEEDIVIEAVSSDWNVVIDDSNLNPIYIKRWKSIAEHFNCEIEFKRFTLPLEEAIKRDSERENPVGEEVIRRFYGKYENV